MDGESLSEYFLERSGYQVHVTKNGREAFEWLTGSSADLVLTDIYMDVMDGMEIVALLKKNYPKIKIIAMSCGSGGWSIWIDCRSPRFWAQTGQ